MKVGLFYKTDDEYSMGIYENFMANLDASFKAELVEAPFNGDSLDFSSQVELLKNCDVVFLPVYTGPAAALMKKGADVCTECKQRNYDTAKNKSNTPDRLEMNKYCRFCRKHTLHKESK